MNKLTDKVIVITGASSGIGEQLAYLIAEKGAKPVLLARSLDKLEQISIHIEKKTGNKPVFYQLDVSDLEQVKEVFRAIQKQTGHIDVLVNNAGFGIFDTFHESNLNDVKGMFEVNVIGLMACIQAVLPDMLKRGSGHIINVASQAGKLATAKSSGYAASKHAVLGLTNSLRMETLGTGIHVTAVNPGPIKTNFFNHADKSGTYVKNVERYMLSPEYVARKIVQAIERPKREVNLPRWMNAGSVLYQLFPGLVEKVAGKALNKK